MQENKNKKTNDEIYYVFNQINELRRIFDKQQQYSKIINDKNNNNNLENKKENNIKSENIKKINPMDERIFNSANISDNDKQQNNQSLQNIKIKQILENIENKFQVLISDNLKLREDKLKALADLENHKKMINNELIDIRKYSVTDFVKNLLPAIDNFERALLVTNTSPEVKNFLLGFEMTIKDIKNVFSKIGVQEIETKIGDKFDSNIHVGIEVFDTKKYKSGTIIKVLQKGYRIYERVIRPVSVNIEK